MSSDQPQVPESTTPPEETAATTPVNETEPEKPVADTPAEHAVAEPVAPPGEVAPIPQVEEQQPAQADQSSPEPQSPAPAEAKPAALRDRLKQAQQPEATQAVPSSEPDKAHADQKIAEEHEARNRGPVEIPRGDEEDLDAIMAAEIEEALSSGEVGQPAPVEANVEIEDDPNREAAEPRPETEDLLEVGSSLPAKVQSIDDENIFLDLGYRSPGLVPKRQFPPGKVPEIGASLTVRVDKYDSAEGIIFVSLPQGRKKVGGNWDEVSVGQVVDCMVNKTNKGGLEVTLGSLRGFMPSGQVDLSYIADLEPFIGQKLQAIVIEVNERKRNLVVSRRSFLEMERKESAQTLWQTLSVGDELPGTVKTLKDYGAFVDIGGADGFLHIGEMSWHHIKHPNEILKEGQKIDVKIVTLEAEKSRIGLSLKALQKDPWMIAAETYGVGTTIRGKVTRTAKFGAFVELEPGIEGLIHISELDHKRIGRVTEVVRDGQEIDAQILSVDPDARRISLSLKAMTAAPTDEDLSPSEGQEYQRKHKGPLKGGNATEESSSGGLFGDPSKFN